MTDLARLALEAMSEKDWDAQLFARKGLATMLGWDSHWTFLAKGSRAGFPDRTMTKERIIFAELKREPRLGAKGQRLKEHHGLTDQQRGWLDRLARAGGEVYVWRPGDLDEIARILSKPWGFFRFVGGKHSFDKPPHLATALDGAWIPRSIWIPGAGRADEVGAA